jgi:hypothetical protein
LLQHLELTTPSHVKLLNARQSVGVLGLASIEYLDMGGCRELQVLNVVLSLMYGRKGCDPGAVLRAEAIVDGMQELHEDGY